MSIYSLRSLSYPNSNVFLVYLYLFLPIKSTYIHGSNFRPFHKSDYDFFLLHLLL